MSEIKGDPSIRSLREAAAVLLSAFQIGHATEFSMEDNGWRTTITLKESAEKSVEILVVRMEKV